MAARPRRHGAVANFHVVSEVCVVPFAVRSRDIAVDVVVVPVIGAGPYTLMLSAP